MAIVKMDKDFVRLGLLSRSHGPACSNVELLFLGQKRRVYRAYGVPGGAILIQRFPVSKKDLMKHAVTTMIVIDSIPSPTTNRIDDTTIVAYSHSDSCLLASATSDDLTIYSLRPFQESLHSTTTPAAVTTQSPDFIRLLSVPFSGILSMKWTMDGEGLILSDQRCQITCMTVSESPPDLTSDQKGCKRSRRNDASGSVDVQWVHKFDQPQRYLSPGITIRSIFAVSSELSTIQLISPKESEFESQEIKSAVALTHFSWNRPLSRHVASMQTCLLTADHGGTIRIWVASPSGHQSYLGANQLQSDPESIEINDIAYHPEISIDVGVVKFIPGSMQACWVDLSWNTECDPRLAWILSTYLVERDGSVEEWCSVHIVHGLPIELEGTTISCSQIVSFLNQAVSMGAVDVQSDAICGVLLRTDVSSRLLLGTCYRYRRSSGTRTALITVDTNGNHQPLDVQLESMADHEILGFAAPVRQLVIHPECDCLCVLTDNLSVGIWDLWPVRKLGSIEHDHLDIGMGIYTVSWINLGEAYGKLGHLVVFGDSAVSICLISAQDSESNPSVNIESVARCRYARSLFSHSIIPLHQSSAENTDNQVTLLIRSTSVDPFIDDEAKAEIYSALQIHHSTEGEITMTHSHLSFPDSHSLREFIVIDKVHHVDGGIVAGTPDGTLEFFKLAAKEAPSLKHCSSCALQSTHSDFTSVISCLATCAHAPYIACITSFDLYQNEDKLFVLQSESMCGSLDYRLEDSFVSPSGDISQISWVQKPSPFPSLVVGYVAGQVDVFVRKRQGIWVPVGSYLGNLQITRLTATHNGLPVVGSGKHLLFLSNDAHVISKDVIDVKSVMQAALSAGGAFPDYHHLPLQALLQLGHTRSIVAALKAVVECLANWKEAQEDSRNEEEHQQTIYGPASCLKEALQERLVPELTGITIGNEVVYRVPFSLSETSSEEKGEIQPTLKPQSASQSSDEDTELRTGQFDISQFSNNFNENHKPAVTFEETGLLDMSAFGMNFDVPAPEPPTVPIRNESPVQPQPAANSPKQKKDAVISEAFEEKDECVLFSTNSEFDASYCEVSNMECHTVNERDVSNTVELLRQFTKSDDANQGPPFGHLLNLTKSNAAALLNVIQQFVARSVAASSRNGVDVPGMKLLEAARLVPLSAATSQPKKSESKNNLQELKKEDFMSPFLRMDSIRSNISRVSLVSGETRSLFIDERLVKGYVSWPETVGIAPGIEAIHLLWAIESVTPMQLLEASLSAMDPNGSHSNRMSWERLRELGCGFWLRERDVAKRVAEEVAKEQFRANNDPHDCALMYVALNKQTLLGRLFRSNGFSRIADLLSKDFSEKRHQDSAAKNAFVLLGQHRHSLAAAFFLVGGHVKDAIGVCAKEMRDPQLALFIATILDDIDDEITLYNITHEIFPDAVAADDRVAQGMLYWIMDKPMEALKAITTVKALKSELSIVGVLESYLESTAPSLLYPAMDNALSRYVPLWMFQQIKNVAAHCAHVLEFCGMPLLALKALQCSQQLEHQFPPPSETTLYRDWSTRLIAAIMVTHLPSPQAVNARDPAMILWHGHVQDDIEILRDFDLAVDGETVFEHLHFLMDCLYAVPASPVFPKKRTYQSEHGHSCLKQRRVQSREVFINRAPKLTETESFSKQIVNSQPRDLLHVDGDRCVGVCLSKEEGFYGYKSQAPKRIAVATGKHGIHFIDWDRVESPVYGTSYWALYDAFEKRRWPSLSWLKQSGVLDDRGQGVSMREVLGGPLKSHPSSTFFLSGCGEESILLWQYGEAVPCARFVLDGRHSGGFESVHRISWSGTGDRIAAIGNGGMCGLWDIASAEHQNAIGNAQWFHRASPRKGHDVEFVNGSGSVIATTGEDDLGRGVFSLWDTLVPRSKSRIAHLEYRHSLSELAIVPGTLIFLSAQESGSIHAHDFRMLGGPQPKALWSLNSIHDGPITSMEVGWAQSTSPSSTWELAVASGGRDGDICISNGIGTSGDLRQRLSKAHWKKPGQLAHFIMTGLRGNLGNISVAPFNSPRIRPESVAGTSVMDLDWCDDGLLSAGADGIVQLFAFSSSQHEHVVLSEH